MRFATLLLFLASFPAVCLAQSEAPKFEDLVAQYEYNKQTSLDFTEVGVEMRGNIMVIDLLYRGRAEVRVPAYLVIPKGDGPFAAIFWGHWLMPGSPLRNRDQFLDEAVVLARAGAVSLLIDLPQARPDFVPKDVKEAPLEWAIQQSEASRQAVIDFRRGLGLLRNRHVDPKRIAYVGHSFGAHVGAILAGVDTRIENFVLMAGNFTDEEFIRKSTRPEVVQWRKQMGEEHMDTYFHEYAWDDPVHFINHTDSDSIFLQFATGDGANPADAQRQLNLFSAKDKESKIYDATHALNSAARLDRARWLQHRLKLKTVDEKALEAIPQLK